MTLVTIGGLLAVGAVLVFLSGVATVLTVQWFRGFQALRKSGSTALDGYTYYDYALGAVTLAALWLFVAGLTFITFGSAVSPAVPQ
jgi:hypothetical protein